MGCLTTKCREDLRMCLGIAWRLAAVALAAFLIVYGKDFWEIAEVSYRMNQIQ